MNLSMVADGLVGQPMFEMRKLIKPDTIRFEIGDSAVETDGMILAQAIISMSTGGTTYTSSSGIQPLKDVICEKYGFYHWCYARLDTITRPMLKSMKRAGINWVGYGIESGNEQIRKENGKGKLSNKEIEDTIKMTHDEGIKVNGNFIFGFENDDINTMQETLGLAVSLKCDWINFYCLVDQNVNQLSKEFLPRPTKSLTAREVLEFRDIAFSQYTGSPRLDRDINPFETGVNYNCG